MSDAIADPWNATDRDVPGLGVIELFARQVASGPERIAVVCDGNQLTFAELDDRSTRLATVLRRAGAVRVGVHLARSLDLVVAILGILKSRSTYIPLDIAQPPRRLAQILGEAKPEILITDRDRPTTLSHDAIVVFGDAWTAVDRRELDSGVTDLTTIAYIMFTSGSTGVPKGVEISHRSLTNFLCSMRERPGFTENDILVAVTTISFDISNLEILLPLITGGRLVLATGRTAADGVALARLLEVSAATVLQATPATWRMLFASGWQGQPGMKALCGGEALPPDLARALRRATRSVWNMYGPTETTIWSTLDEVIDDDGPITIGRPIANTRCYVLDTELAPVAIGESGELYIAGHGVARGYLGQPALTEQRFPADPFHPGERMYKTGDLARRLPDGRLVHLGRLDHQVKIRGFRIELGEIEAALATYPAIREAVVVARELGPDDRRLVAYMTHGPEQLSLAELRIHVRSVVPDYMVPSHFVVLAAMPLTPNGKIDRNQLPAPGAADVVTGELRPPASPLEAEIMSIWCDLLKIDAFDREAEFYELGGHSFLATQVIARIHQVLGVQISIEVMFDHPTVPALAHAIEHHVTDSDLAITPQHATEGATVQVQRYFFRLHEVDPTISIAKEYAAFAIAGSVNADALARAMALVVDRHEILRSRFERRGKTVRQLVGTAAAPLLEQQPAPRAEDVARPFIDRTFDLERGEVVRGSLIRMREDDHVLVTSMHHIAFDYASWLIYLEELGAGYRMFVEGASAAAAARALGELPFQFLDVATRLEAYEKSPAGQRALDVWRTKLAGAERARLPTDHSYAAVDAARAEAQRRGPIGSHLDRYNATFPAGVVTVSTDTAFAQAAITHITRERATPLAFLLSGLAALLHSETEQTDIAFMTNIGTRPFLRAGKLIGPFHCPTFVRVDLSARPTYRALLASLRREVLDMFRYAMVPVLERVEHDVGRLGFGFFGMNVPRLALDLGEPRTTLLPPWPRPSQTHIDFWPMMDLRNEGLTVHFIYNQQLFRPATIERLAAKYLDLLRSIVRDPDAKV